MKHPIVTQLANERRTSGMSVLELADLAGYGESLFTKLECGQRSPSFAALNAWAEALGYEVSLRRIP